MLSANPDLRESTVRIAEIVTEAEDPTTSTHALPVMVPVNLMLLEDLDLKE
jgi:hypothetical protein